MISGNNNGLVKQHNPYATAQSFVRQPEQNPPSYFQPHFYNSENRFSPNSLQNIQQFNNNPENTGDAKSASANYIEVASQQTQTEGVTISLRDKIQHFKSDLKSLQKEGPKLVTKENQFDEGTEELQRLSQKTRKKFFSRFKGRWAEVSRLSIIIREQHCKLQQLQKKLQIKEDQIKALDSASVLPQTVKIPTKQNEKPPKVHSKRIETNTPHTQKKQTSQSSSQIKPKQTDEDLLDAFEKQGVAQLEKREDKKFAEETPVEKVFESVINAIIAPEKSGFFMKEFDQGLDTPKTSEKVVEDLKKKCKPFNLENIKQYLQDLENSNKQICLINRITRECYLLSR